MGTPVPVPGFAVGGGDNQLKAAFCYSQALEGKQGSQEHLAGVAVVAVEGLGSAGAPPIALLSLTAWAGSILNSLGALEQSPWVSLPWHGAQALLNHVHCCWGFSTGLYFPGRETEARSKEAAEDGSQACARSRQMSPAQDGAGELPASPPTLSPSLKNSFLGGAEPLSPRDGTGAWKEPGASTSEPLTPRCPGELGAQPD